MNGQDQSSTAHDRFQEWVAAGVFLKLWKAGVEQFADLKGIDWSWLSMDGAMTKAPYRVCGIDPQSSGEQTVRKKTTNAVDPERGSLAFANADPSLG
jgi:hypothetical protein